MRKAMPARRGRSGAGRRRLRITYVPVKELKLWKDNPRDNDDAADKLVDLIAEFGFVVPVIATRDGVVRAGNTRLKTAMRLGEREVPVIYMDFDSEEEAQAFSLAENKSHEWSTWNRGRLRELLDGLAEVDVSLKRTGFSQQEITSLANAGASKKSFKDAAKGFTTSTTDQVEGLVWMSVRTGRKDLRRLLKDFGVDRSDMSKTEKKRRERELDWEKVREVLYAVEV